MKPAVITSITILMTVIVAAQPRLTFDYPAMARRIVQQLALKSGERVMAIAHPGIFEDLIPYIRYEVMRAGAIDLGVVEVLREPWPEAFDVSTLAKGAREARAHYKAMFRDVDAAIMMPGATTAHPAYQAMQDWLKDDLTERRGRRTIHFHWVENGSAYQVPGQPLPSPAEGYRQSSPDLMIRVDYTGKYVDGSGYNFFGVDNPDIELRPLLRIIRRS